MNVDPFLLGFSVVALIIKKLNKQKKILFKIYYLSKTNKQKHIIKEGLNIYISV